MTNLRRVSYLVLEKSHIVDVAHIVDVQKKKIGKNVGDKFAARDLSCVG